MSFLLICLTGYQNKQDIEEGLPEIVFIRSTDYSQIRSEGETQYVRTFIDKNGNKYETSDPMEGDLKPFASMIAELEEQRLQENEPMVFYLCQEYG